MKTKALLSPRLLERANELRDIMLEVSGMDAFESRRDRESVTARMMIAYRLYDEGFMESDIGRVLNKNHATINHYREQMTFILGHPGWSAEREVWKKFKERI